MTKDEFYAFYLKKNMVPPQQVESIDYYQDEERNANIDDCPIAHRHYDSHLGNNDGEQDDNKIKRIGCITPY